MSAKEIPISELSLQHLNQLSQTLEQEIEFIQNSLGQLKMVQGKFSESKECLDQAKPENLGREILVPLTSSMYVAGQMSDMERVIVDIGTGYYVEKSVNEAREYFSRRVQYLTSQMEKLQPVLQEKYKMKQAVMEMLQMKVQAQVAAQQQSAGGGQVAKS